LADVEKWAAGFLSHLQGKKMQFKHLLAKSSKTPDNPRPEETLVGHTREVLKAAEIIDAVLTRAILGILGEEISDQCWRDALFCTSWLHDLGKANDHFQKMMRNRSFFQGIRHETMGIMVVAEDLQPWLQGVWLDRKHPEWFWPSVIFAVAGHHLKFPDKKDRGGIEVTFLGDHPQLEEFWEIGQELFGINSKPITSKRTYSLLAFGGIEEKLRKLRRSLDRDFTSVQKLFIASLKACLMCADVAGSALPDKVTDVDQDIRVWLQRRIAPVLKKGQLEEVVSQKLRGALPRHFQRSVVEAKTKTVLVEAGCGSGKTAAAYLWAAEQAADKRLFFCYPTTATASEGFAGYLHDPDFEAILVNSKADIDYRLLENLPARSKSQIEIRSLRLEALETWPIPVVVCTTHTVLGLLQNVRRGIYAWPSLVRSAFVFDEIHSYSPRLFEHLLRFLEIFKSVPILLMTATLPPERKASLEKTSQLRGGLFVVSGPGERENANRYVLSRSNEDTAYQEAREVLLKGGKVLWICNTVARTIALVQKALDDDLPVQPFHSRYRYRDRLQRQRVVVDGFLSGKPSMFAVTTQIAEMSLDLSADLLVSEYAPIAAIIQRLGRLNRFDDIPDKMGKALLLKPENALPYAKGEEEQTLFQKVGTWLSIVADGKPKSQRELAEAFVSVEENCTFELDTPIHCDWIDAPWISVTNRHSLMEPGHTIEMIRQEDLAEGPLDEMAIPMPFPKGNSWQQWSAKGRYLIAPVGSIEYGPFWGGKYAQQQIEDWII